VKSLLFNVLPVPAKAVVQVAPAGQVISVLPMAAISPFAFVVKREEKGVMTCVKEMGTASTRKENKKSEAAARLIC